MKKIIIFVLIAIATMGCGIFIGLRIDNEKTKSVSTSNVINNNKVQNNNINSANSIENTVENVNVENQETNEEKTDLDIAIEIVKKDWGEDNTVKFAEDGRTKNGEYIIAVRDINTTVALAWYTVNARTGVFVKE